MAKPVIHISELEAASNFAEVMAQVRAGTEVIIEHNATPIAIVRPAVPRIRLLSEAIELAEAHGCEATLDDGFARDLEAVVNSHREPLSPPHYFNRIPGLPVIRL